MVGWIKKVLLVLGIAFVVFYLFTRPEAAAQGVLAKIPAVKPIVTADYPTPAKRPADSRLDCGKIRAVFGIGPCDWHSALSDLKPYL